MREDNDKAYYKEMLFKFENYHDDHIRDYGEDNEQRLTGHHETQHIDEFSWGIGDRGASVRIPVVTVENDWNGYLEDRRPASNCDPYKVAYRIINTIATKDVQMKLFQFKAIKQLKTSIFDKQLLIEVFFYENE